MWLGVVVLVVAAATAAAVSRDGGKSTGAAATGAGMVGSDFHSLVADPATPGRLFVGGHQYVSTSTDGGRSWSRLDALDGADAMGWAFSAGAVYVSGHPGLHRSGDGAASFVGANGGLPNTDVHAFGAGGSTLYAAGPGLGVVASADGGRSWVSRTKDTGQAFFGRILVAGGDDGQLVAADVSTGAVASSDGGRTWHRLGGPPFALWVSRNGTTLYVSGLRGAARSVDDGASWQDLALPAGASLVEADPSDAQVLYAGIHDGDRVRVMVSHDGGQAWARP